MAAIHDVGIGNELINMTSANGKKVEVRMFEKTRRDEKKRCGIFEKKSGRKEYRLDVELVEFVELGTNLLDDRVEEASRKLGFDLLFEPPVRSEVGDIGLIGGTATAGEHPDDTTIPAQDD